MQNKIDIRIGFWSDGDMDHAAITSLIGRNPDRMLVKGELRTPRSPTSTVVYKKNAWILEASPNKDLSSDEQLDILLDLIEENFDAFQQLCEMYHCEIACALYFYANNGESTPWLHLEPRFMNVASKLKIAFDLDLYNMNANIWLFHGKDGRFASGAFTHLNLAEDWIRQHQLTGTLTQYPTNSGVYDWAVDTALFKVKKEEHATPAFIGKFTTAAQEHHHYENGEKA